MYFKSEIRDCLFLGYEMAAQSHVVLASMSPRGIAKFSPVFTSMYMYYILGYNQLSNSCSMAADEPAHVRACSTTSTLACALTYLLSLFENIKKY
jgi:hypothetical protein